MRSCLWRVLTTARLLDWCGRRAWLCASELDDSNPLFHVVSSEVRILRIDEKNRLREARLPDERRQWLSDL